MATNSNAAEVSAATGAGESVSKVRGSLRVAYQFNIGGSVHLNLVVTALTALQPVRGKLQTSRRIPKDFGYGDDPPVRIDFRSQSEALNSLGVGDSSTINGTRFGVAEVTFYEFGVLEVVLEFEFENLTLSELVQLRAAIADENQSEPLNTLS